MYKIILLGYYERYDKSWGVIIADAIMASILHTSVVSLLHY